MTKVDSDIPFETERAGRLKSATAPTHDAIDDLVTSQDPFADRDRYRRFLTLQHAFHGAIAALYTDETLGRLIPGLGDLARFDAVKADMRDLGMTIPADPAPVTPASIAEALGWLYCSEGSNLGAAFLLKRVEAMGEDLGPTRGARHLAPHPDGRGLHWKAFKAKLNDVPLAPEEDEDQVIAGAESAFAFYRSCVHGAFGDMGPTAA